MTLPRIYPCIPYCHRDEGSVNTKGCSGIGWDLGAAIQRHMDVIPDDSWALMLDHDIAFLSDSWFRQCEDVIALHPDAGVITCMTTRLCGGVARWNMCGDDGCHDISVLRQYAAMREVTHAGIIRDITLRKTRGGKGAISGFFLLISKRCWEKSKRTPYPWCGYHRMDKRLHIRMVLAGFKLLLMEGLVVYHWFRGTNRGKPTPEIPQ